MTYEYPQDFTPVSSNSFTRIIRLSELPADIESVPCTGCVEKFLPYTASDQFFFQFTEDIEEVRFYRATDDTEVIATEAIEFFGTKMFSVIPYLVGGCFYIKVNNDCRLQHGYEPAPTDCGQKTALIESDYKKLDERGNDYSDGIYSNRIRFYADLWHSAEETDTKEENGRVVETKVRSVYTLRIEESFSPESWALFHLLKSALRGSPVRVTFDGKTHIFERFTDSIDKYEDEQAWAFEIKLKKPPFTLNTADNC